MIHIDAYITMFVYTITVNIYVTCKMGFFYPIPPYVALYHGFPKPCSSV